MAWAYIDLDNPLCCTPKGSHSSIVALAGGVAVALAKNLLNRDAHITCGFLCGNRRDEGREKEPGSQQNALGRASTTSGPDKAT